MEPTRIEVVSYEEVMPCAEAGCDGEMQFTCKGYQWGEKYYSHYCNKCYTSDRLQEKYPRIVYERIAAGKTQAE